MKSKIKLLYFPLMATFIFSFGVIKSEAYHYLSFLVIPLVVIFIKLYFKLNKNYFLENFLFSIVYFYSFFILFSQQNIIFNSVLLILLMIIYYQIPSFSLLDKYPFSRITIVFSLLIFFILNQNNIFLEYLPYIGLFFLILYFFYKPILIQLFVASLFLNIPLFIFDYQNYLDFSFFILNFLVIYYIFPFGNKIYIKKFFYLHFFLMIIQSFVLYMFIYFIPRVGFLKIIFILLHLLFDNMFLHLKNKILLIVEK